MKRSNFHRGFFLEMFRQLRTKGLVFTFILAGINLILFTSLVTANPLNITYSHISAQLMAAPMLISLYVMVPVMVFGAYRWIFKRVQSDFYHAIPLTRTQIYASTTAAILLWLFIGLGTYAAVRALLYAIFGLPFNYLLYLCVCINMAIAAIEILAAFSLGSALAGNRFVAFFSGVVILFLPRALMEAFWILVEVDSGLGVPFSMLPFFLNPTFNIAATPIHSLIYGADFANVFAMLYSAVYACALTLLGGVAFYRRKSEAAADIPYLSRGLQTTVRVCFGLPSLAIVTVLVNIMIRYGDDAEDVIGVMLAPLMVTSIFFSFVFYCLYELISSRKMKTVVKSMKFYPLCLVVALFLAFVPAWIGDLRKPAGIDASNIQYYTLAKEPTLTVPDTNYLFETETYYTYIVRGYRFTNEEGKTILARQSKQEQKDLDPSDINNTKVPVKAGLFRKIVYIQPYYGYYYGENQANNVEYQLAEASQKEPGFKDALLAYPEGRIWYQCTGLTAKEAAEIGKLFEEEYNALSAEQRETLWTPRSFRAFNSIAVDSNAKPLSLSIDLYGCKGTQNYSVSYYVNELTPKTAAKYMELLNARNGEQVRKYLKAFVKWMSTNSMGADFIGQFQLGTGNQVGTWSVGDNGDFDGVQLPRDASPDMYRLLKALSDAPLSTDPTNAVSIMFDSYYNDNGKDYLATFEIPQDVRDALDAWLNPPKGEE